MEDECDVPAAESEAARIFGTPLEVFDLPRPSPFGLSLYAAFNRETLMTQDPDRALDELVASLYSDWENPVAEKTAAPASPRTARAPKRRVVD